MTIDSAVELCRNAVMLTLAIGLPADTLHLFDDQGLALERRIPDQNQSLPQAA